MLNNYSLLLEIDNYMYVTYMYHRVCNKSNKAVPLVMQELPYPSDVPEFNPIFSVAQFSV